MIVAGWGVSLVVVRDTAGEREAASLIGYVSMAMALASMLAPMAGGMHLAPLIGAALCLGLGNGLTVPSSSAGARSAPAHIGRPNLAGSASRLSGSLTSATGALFSSITGAVVTEATGATALLGMKPFCAAMGLVAALVVRWIDRREGSVCAKTII